MNVIGDVNGRTCLVIDDLIDTAGTLVKTAAALMENGASQVYACCLAPGAFGAGGREHFAVLHHRSGGDQHHPAERSGEAGTEDQGAYHRWFDRTRDPVDSRRNVRQQIVLIGIKIYGNRNTESNVLEAQPRTPGNKNVARRVRMGGKIPGVLYGAGKESLPVTLDPRQVTRILHSADRPQHHFRSRGRRRRTHQGHDRGLAV